MKKYRCKVSFIWMIAVYCFAMEAGAQTFEWESKISKPDSSGYYHILIEPRISAKLNAAFSDIRIYNEKSAEVPYIIREEQAFLSKRMFRPYRIISKESVKKCCTRLVLHNPARSRISNLSLLVRNSDVQKKMRLSGSDDNKDWYVIKEDYKFSGVYSDSGISEIRMLDFPLSNYEFYKLEIDDSASAPVSVLSAGYYTTYSEIGNYTEIPAPVLLQKDSLEVKHTYVKVTFDGSYNLDRIVFSMEGPRHFIRKARLVEAGANGKIPAYGGTQFLLSSRSPNELDIPVKKTGEFFIVIDNEDDQPLRIKSIAAFQLTRYLAAWLEKDGEYVLRFGNKDVGFPHYDVEYFRDSIPSAIPLAATMGIQKIPLDETETASKRSATGNILMWTAIAAVVLLLGFMTFKMVREMKQ